jgi:hypothetical protein
MSVSLNAFLTAFAGIPPKANAEISTPVSTTTLFALFVRFSPDCLYSVIDVFCG